jgi:HSP20 family protein
MAEWSNRIAQRAYEYFAASGFTNGHDLDDWLKAERELLKPVPLEVQDAEDELIVTAEVPGFNVDDLDISVNGSRLVIQGNHELTEKKTDKKQKAIYSEMGSWHIYRAIELPFAVLVHRAHTELKNGVLKLKLPKAERPTQIARAAA